MNSIIENLLSLLYPKTCLACGKSLCKGEKVICTQCEYHLPLTHFHDDHDNIINQTFWGRIPFESATSLLYFRKGGKVQHLIHHLKYKGEKEVGIYLGRLLGTELKQSKCFKQIDFIIPVPLHPKKKKKRGFNQSEIIGRGLTETYGGELKINYLIRKINSSTQTKKNRINRWENVKSIFEVQNAQELENKKILLIDDVITTGATLDACATCLKDIPGIKIYIASLAYAHS